MYIFLSFLLVIGAFFIYVPACILKKKFSKSSSSLQLPPGNFGWPIIGESLEFLSTMRKGCPEKFIDDRMRKYSPAQVFKTSILGEKMSVLCGPLGNKLLFTNENKLVVSWWPRSVEKIFLSGRSSSSASKGRRSNLVQFLNPDALHKYVSTIQYMVEDHLKEEWIPKDEVTVYPLAKRLTFSLGCRCFVGLEDSQQIAKLAGLFYVVIAGMISIPINFPGTACNRALKAATFIKNELVPIIKQIRSQPVSREIDLGTQYLISQLILETDDNGKFLPEMDIADEILGILVASHDTTSSLITSILYYLADHPLIYARVFEEQMEILNSKPPRNSLLTMEDIQKMKYSRNVVDEVLRIACPALGNFKEVITDFSFGGRIIPKGWKIFLSAHAIHNNDEYFPNPKIFDPSRFEGNGPAPFTFVPFGGGPRMCPGSHFARLQVLIFMHCLVTKFRWEKLFPNEKLTYKPVAVPEKCLPIRLLPHGN